MFTKAELLGYINHCRARVHRTLNELTEEAAARPLPDTHRHRGMTYGVLVGSTPLHVIEHAAQIRQFLTSAGVKGNPCPATAATQVDLSDDPASADQVVELQRF